MRIKSLFFVIYAAAFLCVCGFPAATFSQTPELNDADTIDLPFKDEPLAIFIHQKTLWLVANDTLHVSLEDFRKIGSRYVTDIKELPAPKARIFLLSLSDFASVSTEKLPAGGIRVVLKHTPSLPSQALSSSVIAGEKKQGAFDILTKTASNIISVTDPDSGYEFEIVPLTEAGNGFYPYRSFGRFNVLPTAQGVVIQKQDDDIDVSVNKGIVEVSSLRELKFSANLDEQLNNLALAETVGISSTTLFPYVSWKLNDNRNFVSIEEKLFHDITFGNPESADKARLRLLKIYLGQGLFAEALGMSNDILRNSYKFYHDNKVAALRGAAHFFMHHLEEATRDFSSPELAGDKEIEMWLTLSKEMQGYENMTFNFPANFDRYISKYPPSFIQKMALIAADFNINRKEYDTANAIFSLLAKNNLNEPIAKYIDYMHAKIYSETKNEEEAERIWEKQAGLVDDPLIRASAKFSLINMQIRQDRIAPERAIKELDKLRIVWRGDELELNILTLLGSLYVDEKEYGKALHTLRDIVLYYPQSPTALTATAKMEEIFVKLYNNGGADSMSPLEALATFYEFRDLVPSGKEGDTMVRNLAERLVGIDLLDRAEALLDHQVQKRLQGSERSRIGAHLAAIYLQNHQPKNALDTLKTTGYGELPADLQLTRQRLTARALAEQGHSDKSIEVLNSDNSAEGSMLRLMIYWDNKDWPNVTLTAEEILGNRNDPSAPLTREESGVLLKLATAYVYEHDNGQIQYLRDYFTPLLKNNPDKGSFLFITSQAGTVEYDNLASLDNDISTVKSFLTTARSGTKAMK